MSAGDQQKGDPAALAQYRTAGVGGVSGIWKGPQVRI